MFRPRLLSLKRGYELVWTEVLNFLPKDWQNTYHIMCQEKLMWCLWIYGIVWRFEKDVTAETLSCHPEIIVNLDVSLKGVLLLGPQQLASYFMLGQLLIQLIFTPFKLLYINVYKDTERGSNVHKSSKMCRTKRSSCFILDDATTIWMQQFCDSSGSTIEHKVVYHQLEQLIWTLI